MTETVNLDPRTLTFSQANGYEELPQPLALGEISDDARRQLWDLLWLQALRNEALGFLGYVDWPWTDIFLQLHVDFLRQTLDTFDSHSSTLIQLYRPMILAEMPCRQLFDLWQVIMRHPNCPLLFIELSAGLFKECRLAYFVDTNGPPTIFPAVTPEEGAALQGALQRLREKNYGGAETHLREAGAQINAGEWAESVRESINAVESVARQLDPKGSKKFGIALRALEDKGRIHPALKNTLGGLYGYTSNEQGIRHPLLDKQESPVGRDEAVFMLGACASFVTYLLSKLRAGTTT